jgi:hypothetical protein
MTRQMGRLRISVAAAGLALAACSAMATGPGRACATARVLLLSHAVTPRAVAECGGDACSQVTFVFDEAKQQYRAHNNSEDRWVKVSASNLASSASACLAPGKEQSLALKSVVGSYSADFAEPKCGEAMDEAILF